MTFLDSSWDTLKFRFDFSRNIERVLGAFVGVTDKGLTTGTGVFDF
jgi:hypothetical protein